MYVVDTPGSTLGSLRNVRGKGGGGGCIAAIISSKTVQLNDQLSA